MQDILGSAERQIWAIYGDEVGDIAGAILWMALNIVVSISNFLCWTNGSQGRNWHRGTAVTDQLVRCISLATEFTID